MQSISLVPVQHGEVIPFRGEGRWHHDIFEKCCDVGGHCFMAWCCSVFPLAQISEKHKFLGVRSTGFQTVLIIACVVSLIDLITHIFTRESTWLLGMFCAILCCQLRGVTRKVLQIKGSEFDDCLLSFFCTPCTIIQITGTLWKQPNDVPGCTIDERAAYVV
jgi:Cys-rich protein (TIGR01571 family)